MCDGDGNTALWQVRCQNFRVITFVMYSCFIGCQHFFPLFQPPDPQQEHCGHGVSGWKLLCPCHGGPQPGRKKRRNLGHAFACQEGLCPVFQVSPVSVFNVSHLPFVASSCHDAGAAALLHASQHHLLISAGKKGQVCIWDVRQAKLIHSFKVTQKERLSPYY